MRRSRRFLALIPILGACSVYDESLLVEKPTFDPKSCSWGECWWSEASPSGCKTADQPQPQERPAAASPGSELEIVVALSKIWLGQTTPPGASGELPPFQTFGLDIDGVCTSPALCAADPPDAVSCTNSAGLPADGAGCRDNAFAELFASAAQTSLGSQYGIDEERLNCGLYRGSYNLLIKLSGYSGGLDDNNVRVDVYSSPGLENPLPYECDQVDWATQLTWIAAPEYAWKLDQASNINDPAAYVKNGYLVARFLDGAELALPGEGSMFSGISFKLFKGVLTGRLEQNSDTEWLIKDGVIAGRMQRDDWVTSVRQAGFCEAAGAEYDQFLSELDAGLDVLSTGATTESAPCDSLSVGIAFEARQASAGAEVAVQAPAECTGN